MVVLSIDTHSSEHTVYFEQPLPKPNYIRLLSVSFFNPWDTLKRNGEMSFFDAQDTAHVMTILQGHYTLESISRELQKVFTKYGVELPTEINTPVGQLIIANPQLRLLITFSGSNFAKLQKPIIR